MLDNSSTIVLVDADGWNRRTVQVPLPNDFSMAGGLSLSPDGSRISFALTEYVPALGFPCDSQYVGVIDSDGSGFAILPSPPGTTCAGDAVWSPSGSRLAVDATPVADNVPGPNEVWTMNPDGSDPHLVGAGTDPTWSPDGTHLAFLSNDQIYTVPSTGGVATQLTSVNPSSSLLGSPLWSPQGNGILFTTNIPSSPGIGGPGPVDIMMMNSDGSGVRQLFSSAHFTPPYSTPSWSPDGTRLLLDVPSPAQGSRSSTSRGASSRHSTSAAPTRTPSRRPDSSPPEAWLRPPR